MKFAEANKGNHMADSPVDLIKIGKPSAFHNDIDKDHRVGNFLRSRMNIIDLLPCTYKLNFAAGMETDGNSSGLLPQISYDVMEEYKLTGEKYGLNPVSGIRLYTTDSTTATDSISNSLKDNYFQTGINALSKIGSPIRDMMRSMDQNFVGDTLDSVVESVTTSSNDPYDNLASKVLSTATDVIGKGYRISLPSIWNDSTYTPNFQAQIKLVSPYGHKAAIKEFIIRPLMHLLILSSPKTEDGVSYGNPYCLTIKAYGMNYTPIGMISNITLRRGGNDSSYNIFKQPLSIDVSLDFQYLVKGFAHYKHDKNTAEPEIFAGSDDFEFLSSTSGDNASLPTVGHIVRSLKPREPDIDYTTVHTNMDAARTTKEYVEDTSVFNSLVGTNLTDSFGSSLTSMSISAAQNISDKATLTGIGSDIANSIISGAISSALSGTPSLSGIISGSVASVTDAISGIATSAIAGATSSIESSLSSLGTSAITGAIGSATSAITSAATSAVATATSSVTSAITSASGLSGATTSSITAMAASAVTTATSVASSTITSATNSAVSSAISSALSFV